MKKTAITVLIMGIALILIPINGWGADSNEVQLHKQITESQKPEQVTENIETKEAIEEDPYQGMSKEMREAWENVDKEATDESKHWSKPGMVERAGLAKAAQDTAKAELMLIRKIAQSEDAKETVLAIDKILAKRNKRFDKFIAMAEEEKNKREKSLRTRTERAERKRLTVEERRRLIEERRNRLRNRNDADKSPEN